MLKTQPLACAAAAALLFTAAGTASAAPDVCNYKSRGWSTMRGLLVDISRMKGKAPGGVQPLIRQALAGAGSGSIDEFEIQYARGRSGEPPPNDAVCFPKQVSFSLLGDEVRHACKAELDVKGTVLSLKCEQTGG